MVMTDTERQSLASNAAAEEEQLGLPAEVLPATLPVEEMAALIEAFLLVAAEPPTIEEIAAGANAPEAEIEHALAWLEQQEERGWVLQRHGRRLHLATAPRFAVKVRTFLGLDREARLSSAALEALAIIAYEQPVTRAEIDRVRGVDSSGVLANLHARGLIEPVARLATVGNPIQYGTTAEFLKHFGLRSLADLPPLGEIGGKDGRSLLDAALASKDDEAAGQDENEDTDVTPA